MPIVNIQKEFQTKCFGTFEFHHYTKFHMHSCNVSLVKI
jgi:hypothetical protein